MVCFLSVGLVGPWIFTVITFNDSRGPDHQCDPWIFVDYLRKGSQVLARFLTKQDILHLFFQLGAQDCKQELISCINVPYLGASRYEFQFCCLWTRFVSQGVVCFHSVVLGGSWTFTVITFNDSRGHDRQRAPWIFVDNLRKVSQVLARFLTKQDILHFFLQLASQDCTQELFNCIILPYLGSSRYEFQFYCLRTRFFRQGVVCFLSVGLVGPWIFTVINFNDPRGSTLFVSLYISFVLVFGTQDIQSDSAESAL